MEHGAPATLTAVVAERVRALRADARLSGAALAAAMQERGVPWNRSTVAKLESGRRESVTVQELVVLAVVLGVPPVWLLADPTNGSVPIADGIAVDPWAALLWATGKAPLSDRPGAAWEAAAEPLAQVCQVVQLLRRFHDLQERHEAEALAWLPLPEVTGTERTEQLRHHFDDEDRQVLRAIAQRLQRVQERGLQLPVLPPTVVDRARELGIDLPKSEG